MKRRGNILQKLPHRPQSHATVIQTSSVDNNKRDARAQEEISNQGGHEIESQCVETHKDPNYPTSLSPSNGVPMFESKTKLKYPHSPDLTR